MHPAAQLLHHGGDPVKREKPQKHEMLWGFLFISPFILGLLIFWISPIVAAVGLSFTYWDFFSAPEFIGLTNYKDLIRDPIFHRSVLNTLYYTIVTIPASIVLSLLLAVALNKAIKGIVWLRTCYFLPYVTSTVSVALLWSWLYNYDFGLLNHFLGKLGLSPVAWLTNPQLALPAIMIMSIWKKLVYNIVLYMTGLQNIPQHLYECAKIDVASQLGIFMNISIPLLSPTTFFMLIIGMIGSLQVFEQAYIMTGGGPGVATYTIVYYLWEQGFRFSYMGYASAMGWILFILVFLITIFNWKFSSRFVHYQ